MNPHFITIEGPIGIGKTTLAHAISERFGFFYLQEIVEENPFLERFYENIEEWAFQTEMFFLSNRFKQLKDVQNHFLAKGHSVTADYNILKNTIFAKQTLAKSELEKYLKIYEIMTEDLPKSSLIIYMNASVETIIQRIAKRGRPFERHIQASYIEKLRERYESLFETFQEHFPETPCLTIDGDKLDFIENKEDLEQILQQVGQLLQVNELEI